MKAVYAGSFDPPTNGHMHVIKTAAQLFEKLYVFIAPNAAKKETFTPQERFQLLEQTLAAEGITNVEPHVLSGEFVARKAAELGCQFMVRGVRTASDLEAETTISHVNAVAAPTVQTLVLLAPKWLEDVSSSTVRGLVGLKGWRSVVRTMVPLATMQALEAKRVRELLPASVSFSAALEKMYNEPGRHYHTVGHIADCLEWWKRTPGQRSAVALAIIYHDCVYDPKRTDNEEQSAALMRKNIPEGWPAELGDMILATAKHFDPAFNPTDEFTKTLLDIDLASFADEPAEQEFISNAIRQEYAFVPDDTYCASRISLLSGLLQKPFIYRTEFFREQCEAKARANIAAEIQKLRGK